MILALLFLREPELQDVKDKTQLAEYIISMSPCVADEYNVESLARQLNTPCVCLVLDGYNEYPAEFQKMSVSSWVRFFPMPLWWLPPDQL